MTSFFNTSSSQIDLMRGHPSTELLATDEMLVAANAVLTQSHNPDSWAEDRHPLHYGPDLGNLAFRRDLGIWAASRYGLASPTPPEMINLTAGSSNGLSKALELFTNPIGGYTRRAFILTPVYFLACPIFQDAGFANHLTAIPTSPSGTSIDFDLLTSQLEADAPFTTLSFEYGSSPLKSVIEKPLYRYVLYGVPTFSNPTGTTLSLESRTRLVELARKYDILLITDDVYDFLGYNPSLKAIKRLVDIDRDMGVKEDEKGYTLSNCSFSKLLGPGIRCGWVESASRVLTEAMGRSGANHSGGNPCQFSSTLVHKLLDTEEEGVRVIDRVIKRNCEIYKKRAETLLKAIKEHWPEGTEIWGGEGGYFVWVRLPEGYDVREIIKSVEGKVKVGGGDGFEVPVNEGVGTDNFKDWGKRCLRLSVSYVGEDVIEKGIKVLAEAMKAYKKNSD